MKNSKGGIKMNYKQLNIEGGEIEVGLLEFKKRCQDNKLAFEQNKPVVCDDCGELVEEEEYAEVFEKRQAGHKECVYDFLVDCEGCWEEVAVESEEDIWERVVHPSPFDEEGELVEFCSIECEEQFMEGYFHCECCQRQVATNNGYETYYRWISDHEIICIKCYEELMLEEGQPASDCEGEGISGGSWFSEDELRENGYRKFKRYFIGGESDAKEYNFDMSLFMDFHIQVITKFESLAFGGFEGSVSMWIKPEFPEEWSEDNWKGEVEAYFNKFKEEEVNR